MGAGSEIAKRLCGVIEAYEISFTFHSIARVAHRRGHERRNHGVQESKAKAPQVKCETERNLWLAENICDIRILDPGFTVHGTVISESTGSRFGEVRIHNSRKQGSKVWFGPSRGRERNGTSWHEPTIGGGGLFTENDLGAHTPRALRAAVTRSRIPNPLLGSIFGRAPPSRRWRSVDAPRVLHLFSCWRRELSSRHRGDPWRAVSPRGPCSGPGRSSTR